MKDLIKEVMSLARIVAREVKEMSVGNISVKQNELEDYLCLPNHSLHLWYFHVKERRLKNSESLDVLITTSFQRTQLVQLQEPGTPPFSAESSGTSSRRHRFKGPQRAGSKTVGATIRSLRVQVTDVRAVHEEITGDQDEV